MTSQTQNEILNYTCTIERTNQDTVASATWSIAPIGPTIGTASNSGASSTIFLSKVQAGVQYILSCHITGTSGMQYDGWTQVNGVPFHP